VLRRLLLVPALAFIAWAATPATADAHWAGFTGDHYYKCGFISSWCWAGPAHSYWFNSASGANGVRVCSDIDRDFQSPVITCATTLARLCLGGQVYPNCHDVDGFTAHVAVEPESGTHAVDGHGAY
jgi:hypothetical protein